MKPILSLLAAILCLGTVNACMKKSIRSSVPGEQSLTVLVMDTTQALLDGASVKTGKVTYTTSYDGRVVFKPEQLEGVKSLTISMSGYESARFTLDGSPLAIVKLTPKPLRPGKDEKAVFYESGVVCADRRSEVMYTKMAPMPAVETAEMDGMSSYVEEVAKEVETMSVGYGYVTNNQATAGKLTAGEVNDFTKWSFWPRVLDGSHKQYADEWKIAPRHRYTVQVVDAHGYPVAARAVSLLDNSGNTLFQAVTDNTGKAELWYQLVGNNLCGKHADFYLSVDDQKQIAKEWSEGFNTFTLDEPCEQRDEARDRSSDVDVVFVFDATGSMGDELRYLQAEMKDVISRATEATGGLKIRTGAVVYRDHQDEYLTRISRLTEDIKMTQTFIEAQQANGGGDYPEAVPEALMAALNSTGWNFNARARIAFLILDAPCHQDSVTVALLHEQILNAAALGVRIVPVVCSGLGESGELLLRSIALATNGTSFFLTDDSGIGHPHLKPTTDSLKVEHLNDMLVRTIVEFSYMPDCQGHWHEDEVEQLQEQFVPRPFLTEDVAADPSIPHGPTTLYLMDVSGKLIHVYEGSLDDTGESQLSTAHIYLSTGVYFAMAFYDGQWHTKKLLIH